MSTRSKPLTLYKARKRIKQLEQEVADVKLVRDQNAAHFYTRYKALEDKLNDKTDHLLPQKQQLLKELAYLVNATSKAVRTTMWSLTPGVVRRF